MLVKSEVKPKTDKEKNAALSGPENSIVRCETMLCGRPAKFKRPLKISRDGANEYKCEICVGRGYTSKRDFTEIKPNRATRGNG